MSHYEIERKYLIRYPDVAVLEKQPYFEKVGISQSYLEQGPEGESRRVRKSVMNGKIIYQYNEKVPVTLERRIESEKEITKEEYEAYLAQKDPSTITINKTRYRIFENGFCYEIDLFPFWKSQAFLEVEVKDESVTYPIPPYIQILRDVTEDPSYTNHALSFKIPPETLQDG